LVGLLKEFKGKGYATALIQSCINEAKNENMKGVAVVTKNALSWRRMISFLSLGLKWWIQLNPIFTS
jgi:N-acetylglutamate synthase-like GNAT family acetyltransferase